MLEKVKTALQIISNDFDTEIEELIDASKIDLNIAGAEIVDDSIVSRAIISYCAFHFELTHGSINRADALKKAYDEQKAQLSMATNYTIWS